jgi:hypothetical protein
MSFTQLLWGSEEIVSEERYCMISSSLALNCVLVNLSATCSPVGICIASLTVAC